MRDITRIGVATSKAVFTWHGVETSGRAVLRLNLRGGPFVAFFAKLPSREVALEAGGSSRHWGRQLAALGHVVRLIPPQYVKGYQGRDLHHQQPPTGRVAARHRPPPTRPGSSAAPRRSAHSCTAAAGIAGNRTASPGRPPRAPAPARG
jgi:transposase